MANTYNIDISDTDAFEHQPLADSSKQIRLLAVLPGNPNEDIRVRLSTHWLDLEDGSDNQDEYQGEDYEDFAGVPPTPLDRYVRFSSVPPYNAISYTWGDTQTRRIWIDDQPHTVRENCYYALWQYRLHYSEVYV
ncbi:Hypothetical predicted protein [Lecanosticta acicola]|uniref:Uncharacterized protein n=1 Tax=Lecanosticta acicola TaxID=111012 RepID=A0AAI8Z998_9PEZI|nr:Hypothetical predicted protein [Lecanosticta acicola]